MIMKVSRTQKIEGKEYSGDKFYEGTHIAAGTTEAGMIFDIETGSGSGYCVELPHSDESERYDVYLMENGRTFEHYNF